MPKVEIDYSNTIIYKITCKGDLDKVLEKLINPAFEAP